MTTKVKKLFFNISSLSFGFAIATLLFPNSGGVSSVSYKDLKNEFVRVKNYEQQLRAYESELKEKATKLSNLIDSLQLPEKDQVAAGEQNSDEPMGVGGTEQDLPAGTVEDAFGASFKPTSLLDHSTINTLSMGIKRLRSIPIGAPALGKISSHYGRRISPFSGRAQFHQGLDISAPRGTKVFAPAAGTVEEAKWDGGYGKSVVIDHGDGLKTRYAHLSGFDVKQGDKVTRGQLLGRIGTTGRSTGAHLHYEITLNDKHLDPMRFVELEKEVTELTTGV